ncbi:MAG: MBL fold metallo-hydrolase [Gemmatimonadetes bacterium]|nr:MBL fold metallo-hydrolase [Gemmatimonadota bacterium]
MQLRWLGHSTFELRADVGTVVFEPFPGLLRPGHAFDPNTVVTVSSARLDRAALAGLPESVRVLQGPGEYEVSGLAVRGVPTPLEDPDDPRLINTVYVAAAEGLNVCHLGTLRSRPSAQALQLIGRVDVLMVPAAGDDPPAEVTAAAVREIEPTIILPMGCGPGGVATPAVSSLLSELGTTAGDPVSRLVVTRSNLGEEQRVVLLSLQDAGGPAR